MGSFHAAMTVIFSDVTTAPIDPAEVLTRIGTDEDGAVVLFLGVVRCRNEGRVVDGMTYEGYREMAGEQLARIASEAAAIAASDELVAVHRLGNLAIGDVSVAVAVSSPHRRDAFDAARYVIDEIKRRLPIWKREHYRDGDARWLDGRLPQAAACEGA